jgi:hypothetical protein
VDGLSVYTESRTQTAVASWSVARCSTDVLGAPLSAPVASRALGNCATGRETLGLIGSAAAGELGRGESAAALSISRFERSRWRLRRTRDAMGKATRFRLVFGWAAGTFVSAKETLGDFAAAR